MNSYERVVTTIGGCEPDCVPIMESHISDNVMQALVPGVRGQPEFADAFGLDAVTVWPVWKRLTEDSQGYVDEWQVRYEHNPEMVAHPVQGPIKTRDDLLAWQPPDPDAPWRLGGLEDVVAKYKGKKAIYFHHRVDFMWSVYLMGMENLLTSFYTDPDLAHEVLERVAQTNIAIARRAARAGADIIGLADDYAANTNPLMSPAQFDEFLLERYQRAVHAIKDEGALVMKHCDGNIWQLIDRFMSAPIDMLNPLEPTAGMDIGEVKAKYGDRVTLVGNIDCADLLTFRDPEDVEAVVRETIRVAAPGGRYMISSSNSIHSSVKPENFRMMIDATRRFGRYPIAL